MTIFEAAGRWGEELAETLAAGADPNERNEQGRTPLFFAAKVDAAHVQCLLAAGADPNARDSRGLVPLHLAASVGGREGIAALVAAGAEVDAADENGHTPLLHAIHNGWIEAGSALLVVGANPRWADASGETGLDAISPRLGSGLIDELWRADAYLNGPDRVGQHLKNLIDQGLEGRLLMVLAPRLRPGFFSHLGELELPLANWHELAHELATYCTERGAWQELRTLANCGLPIPLPASLESGVPAAVLPKLAAGDGPYALIAAAIAGGDALPFVLGQANDSVPAVNAALFALVPMATWPTNPTLEARRQRAVATLVASGAALDAPATVALETLERAMALPRDAQGAVQWGKDDGTAARHPEVIAFLTTLASDQPFLPPLLRAARQGSTIVSMLLEAGADPAAVDPSGRGALHFACVRGLSFVRSIETVKDLLDGGLAVDLADHAGWRPLMLATNPAILRALLAAGARSKLDPEERRLLGRAADRQQAAIDAAGSAPD